MLFAILIHTDEDVSNRLSEEEHRAGLNQHQALQAEFAAKGALGPVARLMGSSAAVTVRQEGKTAMILDGPFAETKEQLVGFYVLACDSIEEAIEAARKLPLGIASYEVRPIAWSTAMGTSAADA